MGCRAITPHLVGLAKELEGKPFHLIATDCQRTPKEKAVAYIKGKGVTGSEPNFTVTSAGGHPSVKGNGYVPYYMVFDHHGNLARHHMGGQYHGGDGLAMVDWVNKLLEKTPEIYLGQEEFTALPDLAAQVAGKKKLAVAAKRVEDDLAAGAEGAAALELERLHAALTRYRDRKLGRAAALMATQPDEVMPWLDGVAKELAGTQLAAPVTARIEELKGSDDLKRSVAVGKSLAKVRRGVEKLKSCKPCKRDGSKTIRLTCADCRGQSKGKLAAARKKLEALAADAEGLPIAASVNEFLATLE